MKKFLKKYFVFVLVLYAVFFALYIKYDKNNVPEYYKYYDKVYDILQEDSEEFTTNMAGIYNEYGIEDIFGDDYIAKKEDVEKELRKQGIDDKEIENIEWSAWMSDEEMIRHDSNYTEALHFDKILKGLGILAILFIIFVIIKLI